MLINIKGRNVEVTDALKNYVEKKIAKLEKHFSDIKGANVVLTVNRGYHIVEVQLEGDGILLRCEERRGTDMYGSIDQVVEKLEIRAIKFKDKRIAKTIENGSKEREIIKNQVMADAYSSDEPAEDEMPSIVRLKRFALKPMTAEDAAQRMELLQHDFYVYRDADNERVNVIYKRDDGNYGVIDPS